MGRYNDYDDDEEDIFPDGFEIEDEDERELLSFLQRASSKAGINDSDIDDSDYEKRSLLAMAQCIQPVTEHIERAATYYEQEFARRWPNVPTQEIPLKPVEGNEATLSLPNAVAFFIEHNGRIDTEITEMKTVRRAERTNSLSEHEKMRWLNLLSGYDEPGEGISR